MIRNTHPNPGPRRFANVQDKPAWQYDTVTEPAGPRTGSEKSHRRPSAAAAAAAWPGTGTGRLTGRSGPTRTRSLRRPGFTEPKLRAVNMTVPQGQSGPGLQQEGPKNTRLSRCTITARYRVLANDMLCDSAWPGPASNPRPFIMASAGYQAIPTKGQWSSGLCDCFSDCRSMMSYYAIQRSHFVRIISRSFWCEKQFWFLLQVVLRQHHSSNKCTL